MKDKLLKVIADAIEAKGTHPKVLTFSQARKVANELGTKEELNKAFAELKREGKIHVMEGINQTLIEVV